MVLSAVPVCATFPMDRLLTFVSIGAFGLIARFLHAVFDRTRPGSARIAYRRPAVALAYFLVVVHGVFAPVALPLRAGNPLGPGR
jgi:hypothetical protein